MASSLRTSNPVLNDRVFDTLESPSGSNTATISGAVNKSLILTGLLIASGAWTWYLAMNQPIQAYPWVIGGLIGGLIFGLIVTFVPKTAPYLSPLYAIGQGLFLGAISAMINDKYQFIVAQAAALTVGTLLVMLTAYRIGLIKVTDKFKMGVIAATGAVALFYLVTMVISLITGQPTFYAGNGLLSVGISAVIVVIAALNLALDFEFIKNCADREAPKYMEWYGAFGLLVTLVWLYIEILRLLAKLRER